MNHFTLNDPSAPGQPVYQFVTYAMTPDNTVTLTGSVVNAVNYTLVAKKHTHVCKLTEGAKVYVD